MPILGCYVDSVRHWRRLRARLHVFATRTISDFVPALASNQTPATTVGAASAEFAHCLSVCGIYAHRQPIADLRALLEDLDRD